MKHIQDNWKFILGIFLFIGSLFLAVYLFSLPAKWMTWDIQSKGGTGDAINGMTAPIIGTLGAILIFISFREQVKANRLQFDALNQQRELDIVYKFYTELKEDLKEIQSLYGERHKQPSILDSFMNEVLKDNLKHSSYNDLHVFLKYLNDQFIFLSDRLLETKNLSDSELLALIEKVKHIYNLYFGIYYSNILGYEFHSPLSKEFQKDIKHVDETLHRLNKHWNLLFEKDLNRTLNNVEKEYAIPK